MAQSRVELKGVIHGNTITLDDRTFLPDGYRVTLHLIFEPEEAIRVTSGAWKDMTPDEIASFEKAMEEFDGVPFKMPAVDKP